MTMGFTHLISFCIQRVPSFQKQSLSTLNKYSQHKKNLILAYCSTTASNSGGVEEMKKLLREKFPRAKSIDVEDISGGCGAMYEISVESVEFEGLNTVKQHRLVNDALKEQIKNMHGLRIQTSVPL